MKKKFGLIVLLAIVAGFGVAGGEYIARLNNRTRSLEARLARVEAELNGAKTSAATVQTATPPLALAQQGGAQTLPMSQAWSRVVPQESLERRVEKIERTLTPHLEELPLADPHELRLTR